MQQLLETIHDETRPDILWTLRYSQCFTQWPIQASPPENGQGAERQGGTILFPEPVIDLAFDDGVLRDVMTAWQEISGQAEGFMQFEDREVGAYEDEDL